MVLLVTSLTFSVQFTAPDLSELAHHLDHLERSYDEDIIGQASANMDDTGTFFDLCSRVHLYCLPRVLLRTGLGERTPRVGFEVRTSDCFQASTNLHHTVSLVRWRSEAMKPYHNNPQ